MAFLVSISPLQRCKIKINSLDNTFSLNLARFLHACVHMTLARPPFRSLTLSSILINKVYININSLKFSGTNEPATPKRLFPYFFRVSNPIIRSCIHLRLNTQYADRVRINLSQFHNIEFLRVYRA